MLGGLLGGENALEGRSPWETEAEGGGGGGLPECLRYRSLGMGGEMEAPSSACVLRGGGESERRAGSWRPEARLAGGGDPACIAK